MNALTFVWSRASNNTGHAGWASNQLEREIENGDWLLQSATSDYIFNTPVNDQWDSAVNSFGIDMSHISGRGGVA